MKILFLLLGGVVTTKPVFAYNSNESTRISCQSTVKILGKSYAFGQIAPNTKCRAKIGDEPNARTEYCRLTNGKSCEIKGINAHQERVRPDVVPLNGFNVTGTRYCIEISTSGQLFGNIFSRPIFRVPSNGEACNHTALYYRYESKNIIDITYDDERTRLTWNVPAAIGSLEGKFRCTIKGKDNYGFFTHSDITDVSGTLPILGLHEVTIACSFDGKPFARVTKHFKDQNKNITLGNFIKKEPGGLENWLGKRGEGPGVKPWLGKDGHNPKIKKGAPKNPDRNPNGIRPKNPINPRNPKINPGNGIREFGKSNGSGSLRRNQPSKRENNGSARSNSSNNSRHGYSKNLKASQKSKRRSTKRSKFGKVDLSTGKRGKENRSISKINR